MISLLILARLLEHSLSLSLQAAASVFTFAPLDNFEAQAVVAFVIIPRSQQDILVHWH